jgi:hypothetical protein
MGPLCFTKKDTNPPVCGVHNIVLEKINIAIDPNAPHLGYIPCYVCPVSLAVVLEEKAQS